jgi:hypothetical protein
MRSKLLFGLLVALILSSCNPKSAVIQDELRLIEKTAKDTSQTKYIRDSAAIFSEILTEKQEISRTKLSRAHWAMVCDPNPAVITTYVAFLKALEKQIPDKLPSVEIYEAMHDKVGRSEIVEYNVGQTAIMMSNSIQNISLYGNALADVEVEGVLKRLTEKLGTSETGKKILEFLNMVHGQGLEERKSEHKPWKSPRRPEVYEPGPVD